MLRSALINPLSITIANTFTNTNNYGPMANKVKYGPTVATIPTFTPKVVDETGDTCGDNKGGNVMVIDNHKALQKEQKLDISKNVPFKTLAVEITRNLAAKVSLESLSMSRIFSEETFSVEKTTFILGKNKVFEKTCNRFCSQIIQLKLNTEVVKNVRNASFSDIINKIGIITTTGDNHLPKIITQNGLGQLVDLNRYSKVELKEDQEISWFYPVALTGSAEKSMSMVFCNLSREEIDALYNQDGQLDLFKERLDCCKTNQEKLKMLSKGLVYFGMEQSRSVSIFRTSNYAVVGNIGSNGKGIHKNLDVRKVRLTAVVSKIKDAINTDECYAAYKVEAANLVAKFGDLKIWSQEWDGFVLLNAQGIRSEYLKVGKDTTLEALIGLLMQCRPAGTKLCGEIVSPQLFSLIMKIVSEISGVIVYGDIDNIVALFDSNAVKLPWEFGREISFEILSNGKTTEGIIGTQFLTKMALHYQSIGKLDWYLGIEKAAFFEEIQETLEYIPTNAVSPQVLISAVNSRYQDNVRKEDQKCNDPQVRLNYYQQKVESLASYTVGKLQVHVGGYNNIILPDKFGVIIEGGIIPQGRVFTTEDKDGGTLGCFVKSPSPGKEELYAFRTIGIEEIVIALRRKRLKEEVIALVIQDLSSLECAVVVPQSPTLRNRVAGFDYDMDKLAMFLMVTGDTSARQKLRNALIEAAHQIKQRAVICKQNPGVSSGHFDSAFSSGIIGEMVNVWARNKFNTVNQPSLGSIINCGQLAYNILMMNDPVTITKAAALFANSIAVRYRKLGRDTKGITPYASYHSITWVSWINDQEIIYVDDDMENMMLLNVMGIAFGKITLDVTIAQQFLEDLANIFRKYGEGTIDSTKHGYTIDALLFQDTFTSLCKKEIIVCKDNKFRIQREGNFKDPKGRDIIPLDFTGKILLSGTASRYILVDRFSRLQDELMEYINKEVESIVAGINSTSITETVYEGDIMSDLHSLIATPYGASFTTKIAIDTSLTSAHEGKEVSISQEEFEYLYLKNSKWLEDTFKELEYTLMYFANAELLPRLAVAYSFLNKYKASGESVVERMYNGQKTTSSIHKHIGGRLNMLALLLKNNNFKCYYELIKGQTDLKINDGEIITVVDGYCYNNDQFVGLVKDKYTGELVARNDDGNGKVFLDLMMIESIIKSIKEERKNISVISFYSKTVNDGTGGYVEPDAIDDDIIQMYNGNVVTFVYSGITTKDNHSVKALIEIEGDEVEIATFYFNSEEVAMCLHSTTGILNLSLVEYTTRDGSKYKKYKVVVQQPEKISIGVDEAKIISYAEYSELKKGVESPNEAYNPFGDIDTEEELDWDSLDNFSL